MTQLTYFSLFKNIFKVNNEDKITSLMTENARLKTDLT